MTIDEFIAYVAQNQAPPAGEAQIAAFEAKAGHALPLDYRAFLGRCGGGYISASICYRLGAMHEFWNTVGGLRADPEKSLAHHIDDPGFGPLPQNLIWIGDDGSGNPITLSLRDDRFGEIFVIDHELCAFEGERETIEAAEAYGLAMSAAHSFTDFVAGLTLDPD